MKTKQLYIQIIRIISMFSIIACHIITNNAIAEFLTFGIFTFIFMSGYLYSKKKIDNNFKWFIKQYKKITIPVLIYLIFLIIVFLVKGEQINYFAILVYIFNLKYFFEGIIGINHLWFCSVIMICYLLTLKKETIKKIFNKKYIAIIIFVLICISSFLDEKISNLLFMIYVFFLGMYYKENKNDYNYSLIKTLLLVFFAISIKLITHIYIDETPIYNSIVYSFVHTTLAFSLFTTIQFNYKRIINNSNKIIDYFDNISYYVYITHYSFIVGPLTLMNVTDNYYINTICVLAFSFFSATILKLISEQFSRNKNVSN